MEVEDLEALEEEQIRAEDEELAKLKDFDERSSESASQSLADDGDDEESEPDEPPTVPVHTETGLQMLEIAPAKGWATCVIC